MRSRFFIGAYLCLLATWMQLLAPMAAMSMERQADPFAVICASSTAGQDRGAPAHHHQQCDHCLLCHAYLGAAPLDGRPVYTAFDHPSASPLRWHLNRVAGLQRVPHRESQPRAPPQTV